LSDGEASCTDSPMRRPVRRGQVLVESGRQRFDACLDLGQALLYSEEICLHRRWGLLPILLWKGK
jgi:hypothetical protein